MKKEKKKNTQIGSFLVSNYARCVNLSNKPPFKKLKSIIKSKFPFPLLLLLLTLLHLCKEKSVVAAKKKEKLFHFTKLIVFGSQPTPGLKELNNEEENKIDKK